MRVAQGQRLAEQGLEPFAPGAGQIETMQRMKQVVKELVEYRSGFGECGRPRIERPAEKRAERLDGGPAFSALSLMNAGKRVRDAGGVRAGVHDVRIDATGAIADQWTHQAPEPFALADHDERPVDFCDERRQRILRHAVLAAAALEDVDPTRD